MPYHRNLDLLSRLSARLGTQTPESLAAECTSDRACASEGHRVDSPLKRCYLCPNSVEAARAVFQALGPGHGLIDT